MAAEEPVFIMRRNARPVMLTSADDFYVPTKDELLTIQKGQNDIEEDKGITATNDLVHEAIYSINILLIIFVKRI